MTHPIFSPDSDAASTSDGHNTSTLNTVLANIHYVETFMNGKSIDEQEHALPQTQGFAPRSMCITELADKCMQEINNYHSGEHLGERYFKELLIRAILQKDQDACKAMHQCLDETVRGWLVHHPNREAACRLDSEENYITLAFARFHQAAIQQQVELRLPSALQYLRVSLNSALLDALRTSSMPKATLLPERKSSNPIMSTTRSEFWEMLEKMPLDYREQRLANLLFNCGLGPKDIVNTFPEEFNDVREISLLRCTIIKRLINDVDQHNGTNDTSRNINSTKVTDRLGCGERED